MPKIRPYGERDFATLCAIFLRAIKETASADYSPRQIAAWAQVDEARWRQKIAASRVLVAVKEASPVGFITTVDDYIDLLFVSPDYSRQGIASALLNALIKTDCPRHSALCYRKRFAVHREVQSHNDTR